MRVESLRDAAENLAYAEIEAKYGLVPWQQTYVEFWDLVIRHMNDEKFIARFQRGRKW